VAQVEVLGTAAREVGGEGDAVVRRSRLLGEDRGAPGAGGVAVAQRLDQAVRDHAAPDHHEVAGRGGVSGLCGADLRVCGVLGHATTLGSRGFGAVGPVFPRANIPLTPRRVGA